MGIEKNLADFLPSDVEAVAASERDHVAWNACGAVA